MCRALGSSRTREKEPCDRVLSVPCGFHMVAELPGAATAKAMSRPEQEETGEVFEEANGGQSEASELMAGGPQVWQEAQYLFHNCLFPVECNKQHLLLEGCSK